MDYDTINNIRDTILYRNNDEKKSAYRNCIEYVIKHDDYCSSFSVDELEKLLNNPDEQTDDNRADWTFHDYLNLDEGIKLFELACQKYGYKLWNGNAWHNKTCKRNCPLADFCNKYTVDINGERLCRGQVYCREINWKDLPDDTSIYKQDGSLYITKKQDDQSFSNFFEFSLDIIDFGWSKRGGSQITGGNVILKLYKEAIDKYNEPEFINERTEMMKTL